MKRTSDLTHTPKRLHLSLSPNTPSASGSCYVEIGSTKVLCSVYGPREASSSSSGVFGSSINSSEFSTRSADTLFSSSSSSSSSPTPRTTLPKTSDAVDDAVISQQLSSSEEDAHGILEVTVQFAPFAKRVRSGIGGTIGGAGVVAQIAANTLGGGGGGGGGGKGVSSRGGNVFDASSSSIIEEERQMSRFLERALSPSVLLARIPKCIVEVHVWVLEAGGGETEAAVIGTSMALVDAGVEVIDLCVGATVVGVKRKRKEGGKEKEEEEKVRFLVAPISKNPDQLLDDIGMDEEERGRRGGGGEEEDNVEVLRTSICMMMKRGLLTHTLHEGAAEGDEIIEALTVAMDACASSYQVMRETLLKRAAEVSSSSSSSSS